MISERKGKISKVNQGRSERPKAASLSVSAIRAVSRISESDLNKITLSHILLKILPNAFEAMPPAKRKASVAADATSTGATKRQKKVVEPTASSSRPSRTSLAVAAAPRSTRSSMSENPTTVKPAKNTAKAAVNGAANKSKTATNVRATDGRKRQRPAKTTTNEEEPAVPGGPSSILVDVPLREKPAVNVEAEEEAGVNGEGPAYWLMKAEPESRIEKGKDVKFSIDDLKAANEPEGWDGMYWY